VQVPRGARRVFRVADVEKLVERGFTLPEAPQKVRRVRSRASTTPEAIAAELEKF